MSTQSEYQGLCENLLDIATHAACQPPPQAFDRDLRMIRALEKFVNGKVSDAIHNVNSENSGLTAHVKYVDDKLFRLKVVARDLENVNAWLRVQLADANAAITRLSGKYNKLVLEPSDAYDERRKLKAEVDDAKRDVVRVNELLAGLRVHLEDYKAGNDKLVPENYRLRRDMESAISGADDYKRKLGKCDNMLTDAKAELCKANDRIAELMLRQYIGGALTATTNDKLIAGNRKLTLDLSNANAEVQELKAQLKDGYDDYERSVLRIDD